MATIKHISSKNADYGAAEAYLTFEHDEFTMKPTLDEAGRLIPRQDYRLDTLNCGEEDFALSCIRANLRYGKNSKREDIKSHHYIISFDPRDAADNGLTVDRAQALGLAYCKEHFPGHQALVCTHPDEHNHSGNIHVHLVRISDPMTVGKATLISAENRPTDGRKSDLMTVGKPTPNNLTINNLIENQTMGVSGEPHKPFGRYENVFLTGAEYAELKTEFPDRLERLIEEMSRYLAANGRTYQNYAAALRIWAENDKKGAPKQGIPDYTCKEGESL